VKYFRAGWKQPILLGARKIDDHGGIQAFDEGGEVTVEAGARLFFPGSLVYEGQPSGPILFSEAWPGGKASRLYEAFRDHWKTKQIGRALEKLSIAAASDQPETSMGAGLALVSQTP
jgi:hypothetical protein